MSSRSLGVRPELTASAIRLFRSATLATRPLTLSTREVRFWSIALHVVALDGVYLAGPGGQPVFRELPRLKTAEVADVVQIAKVRILKALERRGVVRVSPESLEVDDVLSARDPALAQLAAAAVAGLAPAGPAERKREPVLFPAGGEPEIVGELVVQDSGFNVHESA